MQPQGTYSLPKQSSNKNLGLIILSVVAFLAIIFGVWAFSSRTHYKNLAVANSVQAVAATSKQQAAQTALDAATKQPYKTYISSPTNGSISFSYPKNYSAYVDETGTSEPINGYFHPGQVPGVQSKTAFALRLELVNTAYSDVLNTYSSLIKSGAVKATAYTPPKLNGVANAQPGTRLDGQISTGDQTIHGSMLVITVRDKTLQIYTDSSASYGADFNNIVLPSLTFAP